MKTRNTITSIFTLLTGSLFLVIFLLIYYFSAQYTKYEFYQRLEERVTIVTQTYLEQDELSATVYEEIRKKHLQILPDEQEYILPVSVGQQKTKDKPTVKFPPGFLDRVSTKKKAIAKSDNLYYSGILYADNEGDFLVIVSARDLYGLAKMKILLNILILSFLGGVISTYFVGRYYVGRVLKPISAISDKANKISVSNLHLRLQTNHTDDELDELAITFNGMLDRLETAFDLQNNFINNASHELKNPLTAILGEVEVTLSKERSPQDYQASLSNIQKEAQRLDLLINSLLKLAQTGMEDKQLIIEEIRVDELLMLLKQHMDQISPQHQIVFDFSKLPEQANFLVIRGNQNLLMIALNNLVDNACKFSQNQVVTVSISTSEHVVNITIQDQGVGIPKDDLKNITEPLYRAANARSFRGFGIGLPLTQKIINLHGGKMHFSSVEHQGTQVFISFPQQYPTAVSAPDTLISL